MSLTKITGFVTRTVAEIVPKVTRSVETAGRSFEVASGGGGVTPRATLGGLGGAEAWLETTRAQIKSAMKEMQTPVKTPLFSRPGASVTLETGALSTKTDRRIGEGGEASGTVSFGNAKVSGSYDLGKAEGFGGQTRVKADLGATLYEGALKGSLKPNTGGRTIFDILNLDFNQAVKAFVLKGNASVENDGDRVDGGRGRAVGFGIGTSFPSGDIVLSSKYRSVDTRTGQGHEYSAKASLTSFPSMGRDKVGPSEAYKAEVRDFRSLYTARHKENARHIEAETMVRINPGGDWGENIEEVVGELDSARNEMPASRESLANRNATTNSGFTQLMTGEMHKRNLDNE